MNETKVLEEPFATIAMIDYAVSSTLEVLKTYAKDSNAIADLRKIQRKYFYKTKDAESGQEVVNFKCDTTKLINNSPDVIRKINLLKQHVITRMEPEFQKENMREKIANFERDVDFLNSKLEDEKFTEKEKTLILYAINLLTCAKLLELSTLYHLDNDTDKGVYYYLESDKFIEGTEDLAEKAYCILTDDNSFYFHDVVDSYSELGIDANKLLEFILSFA